ncbi:MAG: hypothetical protein ACTSQE_14390 [Candidatus Heimdallarchaeaceae archaeon]
MQKKAIGVMTFLVVIFVFLAGNVLRNTNDNNSGRRVDPFRCSDAKYYFEKVGVEVDCRSIDCEVNKDCVLKEK